MKTPGFPLAALMVAALLSAPAGAAPLSLGDVVEVGNAAGNVFTPSPVAGDSNGLYTGVGFVLDAGTAGERRVGASAGLFVLDYRHATSDPWTQFLSFCLQPDVYLTPFSNPYTVHSVSDAGYADDRIAELWGRHFGSVVSDLAAAAFQVALWELSYGDRNGDLASGSFRLSNTGSAVFSTAQGWLDSLNGTGPRAGGLRVLINNPNLADRQDLITQVPEPGTLALLSAGLFAVGAARRRKRG